MPLFSPFSSQSHSPTLFAARLASFWPEVYCSGYMRILLSKGGNAALLPLLHWPGSARRPRHLDICRSCCNGGWKKESVVVVMGATGTGKSKLSVELAIMHGGEVVNSDKIQVYRELDITTNKIPISERRGVPHHLLGELDPVAGELPPAAFREMAARAIAGIADRGRLPVLAGGSNSFVYAAVASAHDPRWSPFEAGLRRSARRKAAAAALRYRCCFLWVDVDAAALAEQLDRRVEEMVAGGMVDELERYFTPETEVAARMGEEKHPGLRKAIGVAEFREYFRGEGRGTATAYEKAVAAIKQNTRWLAAEQVRKIELLREMGWLLRRLDATAAVAAQLAGYPAEAKAAWERDVAGPGAAAVKQLLEEEEGLYCRRHHRIGSSPLLYT